MEVSDAAADAVALPLASESHTTSASSDDYRQSTAGTVHKHALDEMSTHADTDPGGPAHSADLLADQLVDADGVEIEDDDDDEAYITVTDSDEDDPVSTRRAGAPAAAAKVEVFENIPLLVEGWRRRRASSCSYWRKTTPRIRDFAYVAELVLPNDTSNAASAEAPAGGEILFYPARLQDDDDDDERSRDEDAEEDNDDGDDIDDDGDGDGLYEGRGDMDREGGALDGGLYNNSHEVGRRRSTMKSGLPSGDSEGGGWQGTPPWLRDRHPDDVGYAHAGSGQSHAHGHGHGHDYASGAHPASADRSASAGDRSGGVGTGSSIDRLSHQQHADDDDDDARTDDDIRGRAIALYAFEPEHENEFALVEGQLIYVSSSHGLGWLVAVDPLTGDCGLVPEEYVEFVADDEDIEHRVGDKFSGGVEQQQQSGAGEELDQSSVHPNDDASGGSGHEDDASGRVGNEDDADPDVDDEDDLQAGHDEPAVKAQVLQERRPRMLPSDALSDTPLPQARPQAQPQAHAQSQAQPRP